MMKTNYAWPLLGAAALAALMAGCARQNGPGDASVVTVSGTGTVMARPDVTHMSVTLGKTERTTKAAREEVAGMARRALAVLKEAGVEDKYINTASLSFNAEYEYAGRRVLVGQKAEQRISFSLDGVDDGGEKVSAIIDGLILIDGIALDYVTFGIKNGAESFAAARDLAFQKAAEKASRYAALSNMKVVKMLSVTEEGVPPPPAPRNNRLLQAAYAANVEAASDESAGSALPAGEMEITARVTVTFLLK